MAADGGLRPGGVTSAAGLPPGSRSSRRDPLGAPGLVRGEAGEVGLADGRGKASPVATAKGDPWASCQAGKA